MNYHLPLKFSSNTNVNKHLPLETIDEWSRILSSVVKRVFSWNRTLFAWGPSLTISWLINVSKACWILADDSLRWKMIVFIVRASMIAEIAFGWRRAIWDKQTEAQIFTYSFFVYLNNRAILVKTSEVVNCFPAMTLWAVMFSIVLAA